jgi:hypothetical protein
MAQNATRLVDHLPTRDGVVHAGGGDQHDQQQAEHVGGDVALAALDPAYSQG